MKKRALLLGATGLVGRAAAGRLGEDYQIIPAAGRCAPENGYCLPVEAPEALKEVLLREDPDVVISSVRGDYPAQITFHRALAEWLAGKDKRLLYMSTANVFDGRLTQPWTEADPPAPASDYGVFKRDCEAMLGRLLGEQLTVFRLAAVWSPGCPRVRQLRHSSESGEPHPTYPGYTINVTLADQIGDYARYVLSRKLHGIFHVGTTDTVNYAAFEEMVSLRMDNGENRFGRIVQIDGGRAVIQVFEGTRGMSLDNTRTTLLGHPMEMPLSPELLGRTFNGAGRPIDGLGEVFCEKSADINGKPLNPVSREYPRNYINTGISSIDALATLIRGQKLPIFSGSGMGHNKLAVQIVQQARLSGADADSFVIVFVFGYYLTERSGRTAERLTLIAGICSVLATGTIIFTQGGYDDYIYNNAPTAVFAAGAIVVLTKRLAEGRVTESLFTRLIGKYSFSILMIHWGVLHVAVKKILRVDVTSGGVIGGCLVMSVLTLVLSAAGAVLVDNTLVAAIRRVFSEISQGIARLFPSRNRKS